LAGREAGARVPHAPPLLTAAGAVQGTSVPLSPVKGPATLLCQARRASVRLRDPADSRVPKGSGLWAEVAEQRSAPSRPAYATTKPPGAGLDTKEAPWAHRLVSLLPTGKKGSAGSALAAAGAAGTA
jgi:hypothetical protein